MEIEDEDLHMMRRLFNTFDKDGSGSITPVELTEIFKELGEDYSEQNLNDAMSTIDLNQDGYITFHEFLSIYKKQVLSKRHEAILREAFEVCDYDESGFITFDELKKTMFVVDESLSDEQLRELLKDADLNRDSKINVEEFIQLMKNQL